MKLIIKRCYLCPLILLMVMPGTAQEENEVNGTTLDSSFPTSRPSFLYQDNLANTALSVVTSMTSLGKVSQSNGSAISLEIHLEGEAEVNPSPIITGPQWDLIELPLSNDSCISSQVPDSCIPESLSQEDFCPTIHALYFLGDHPTEGYVFMALIVGVDELKHLNISRSGETKKVTLCSENSKKKSVLYILFAFYTEDEVIFDVDKLLKITDAKSFIEYLIPLPVECRTILMTSMAVQFMTPAYIMEIDVRSSPEYHELCLTALPHGSDLTTLSSGNTFYVSSFCYIFVSDADYLEQDFCEVSLRNPPMKEEMKGCLETSESTQSFFYHGMIREHYYFLWYNPTNEFCRMWSKGLPEGPAGSKVLSHEGRIWMWIYERPIGRQLIVEGSRMSTTIILHIHNMSNCILAFENAFVFDESFEHLNEVSEVYFLSVYDSQINQFCLEEAQNLTNQILHGNRKVDFTENFPSVSFSTEENYSLFTLKTLDESFFIVFAKQCSKVERSQAHYLVTGILCKDELDWNFYCRSDIYLSWQLKISNHIDFTSVCSTDSSLVDAVIKNLEKIPGNWRWTYVEHLCGSGSWDPCMDVENENELGKLMGSQWSLASQYVDYFSMTCINYRVDDIPVVLFFNKKVKCHNRTKEDQQFILGVFDSRDKNYDTTSSKHIQTNVSNRDWVSEITFSNVPDMCPLFSWKSNDEQFLLDLLTGSIFDNDTTCLEHICTDIFEARCIYESCSPIILGPLDENLYNISCFKYLPGKLWWDINVSFKLKRSTINRFWAIESYNYLIIYIDMKENVTSLDWSYLSKPAKAWETLLVSITIIVTASLILGNFLVMFVMIAGGHRGEISGILRSSLSVSDFLTGLFPCSLAVSDALSLITGRLTLYDLDSKAVLSSFDRHVSDMLPSGLTELKFERFGYPAFCSLIFAISSTSSLLTHFCLAIERYRAVSPATVKGTMFNTSKKRAAAVMAPWMTAVIFAFICGCGNGSFLRGYLDPITKLTLWLPASDTLVVSTVFFWLQFVIVGIFIIATLIWTLLSVKTFTEEREREMKENQEYYVPSEEEVAQSESILRRGRTTLFLTAILLGGSLLPMALSSFWRFPRHLPLLHYLMWWFFIAGMSCNWIVYNMRSKLFYSDMAESLLLLRAILPARIIRNLENRVTDPRHPPPVTEEDQMDLYQCVFPSAGGDKNSLNLQKEARTANEDFGHVCNGSMGIDQKDVVNAHVKSSSVKVNTRTANEDFGCVYNGSAETDQNDAVNTQVQSSLVKRNTRTSNEDFREICEGSVEIDQNDGVNTQAQSDSVEGNTRTTNDDFGEVCIESVEIDQKDVVYTQVQADSVKVNTRASTGDFREVCNGSAEIDQKDVENTQVKTNSGKVNTQEVLNAHNHCSRDNDDVIVENGNFGILRKQAANINGVSNAESSTTTKNETEENGRLHLLDKKDTLSFQCGGSP